MRSRFDRHTIQDLAIPPAQLGGQTVGGEGGIVGPTPSQGAYYTEKGITDSPFDTVRGPKMDQMVQMLENSITSNNHGYPRGPGTMTYGPAPGGTDPSVFQDLDGGLPSSNPALGQFGVYSNPDTGATYGG